MESASHWRPALVCGLLAGVFFYWLIGSRVDILNDEGIYLDGARRILAGQAPYRDFFALTGPGHFWNLALSFRLLGMTFAHARLTLVIDLALLTGGLFWLASELASRRIAAVLSFGFVGLLAGNGGMLKVTHRWDSSAVALVAVILFWEGWRRRSAWILVAAGAAAGYAAWITPSMLALAGVIAVWLIFQDRRLALLFAAGMCVVSGVAAMAMAAQGSLRPMVEHLLWTSRNYSGANQVGYGSIPGGYGALFEGVSTGERAIRFFVLCFVCLPAILPPICLGWFLRPRRELMTALPLLLCAGALVASGLPRWDLDHLEYVEPLLMALAAGLLARLGQGRLAGRALPIVGVIFLMGVGTFFVNTVLARWGLPALETRRGIVHGTPSDLALIRDTLEPMPAGASVFVYPYFPTFYFFMDAVNPTRYNYLQPGMMTADDERSVVADLERSPPRAVLYSDLPESEILRVFPSSDPTRLRQSLVADWLRRRYEPAPSGPAVPGLELLVPRGATAVAK